MSFVVVAQSSSYNTDTAYVGNSLRAGEAIESSDAKKALGYYQKAYTVARRVNYANGYFEAVRLLAFALNNAGRSDEAKAIVQQADTDTSKRHKMICHAALAIMAARQGDQSEAVPEVGKISAISAAMVTSMNEIIWSLNTRNDSLNGLIAYIHVCAREFIDNTPLTLKFDISESPGEVIIRGVDRRNLFLTVKEALNNVVKHAQATEVTLRMQPQTIPTQGGTFHVDVCDNGRGFDPASLAHAHRNGLINMQLRMQESGGTCTVASTEKGTYVRVCFPY